MNLPAHAVLEVEDLSISYLTETGPVRVVRNISIYLEAGASLALVGESGSGKSTLALALLGLLGRRGRIDGGEIRFKGDRLSLRDERSWARLRGKEIGMVFQDARGGLNPVMTIGAQVIHALQAHQRLDRAAAHDAAAVHLAAAGIPEPAFFMRRFPDELSGGMCQRAAIAIAVCHQPGLLIADEPTSALDPSIQAQILDLLRVMRRRFGLSLLLISHDLALVSEISEAVAVMYHGRLVESGPKAGVYRHPAHPYTASLLKCQADLRHRWDRMPLASIPGSAPPAGEEVPGCAFAARCPKADSGCLLTVPPPVEIGEGHWAACLKAGSDAGEDS